MESGSGREKKVPVGAIVVGSVFGVGVLVVGGLALGGVFTKKSEVSTGGGTERAGSNGGVTLPKPEEKDSSKDIDAQAKDKKLQEDALAEAKRLEEEQEALRAKEEKEVAKKKEKEEREAREKAKKKEKKEQEAREKAQREKEAQDEAKKLKEEEQAKAKKLKEEEKIKAKKIEEEEQAKAEKLKEEEELAKAKRLKEEEEQAKAKKIKEEEQAQAKRLKEEEQAKAKKLEEEDAQAKAKKLTRKLEEEEAQAKAKKLKQEEAQPASVTMLNKFHEDAFNLLKSNFAKARTYGNDFTSAIPKIQNDLDISNKSLSDITPSLENVMKMAKNFVEYDSKIASIKKTYSENLKSLKPEETQKIEELQKSTLDSIKPHVEAELKRCLESCAQIRKFFEQTIELTKQKVELEKLKDIYQALAKVDFKVTTSSKDIQVLFDEVIQKVASSNVSEAELNKLKASAETDMTELSKKETSGIENEYNTLKSILNNKKTFNDDLKKKIIIGSWTRAFSPE